MSKDCENTQNTVHPLETLAQISKAYTKKQNIKKEQRHLNKIFVTKKEKQ